MPYKIRKARMRNEWEIINKETGEVVGRSDSKEKAEASVRARYAAESKKKKK